MIGIFDSGIGGITILKEILKKLPNENYIYYSDSLNNPYGDKSEDELLEIVDNIIKFFISKQCKVIVFACNTATAITIDKIRNRYPDLICIGTEPAYKMVHDYSYNKKTLVMATPGTIQSERFKNLYNKYDNHNTYLLECSNLAKLIEEDNQKEIELYLKDILSQYKDIETVVLGCTHYPLVKDIISKILGDVEFYDSGIGVANQLYNVLKEKELLTNNQEEGNIIFIDSTDSKAKKERFYKILEK